MKRPTFELLTAIEWYVADYEVEPTTMQSYRSHFTRFAAWLAETRRPVILASVEPETIEAHLRATRNRHTKMNKCIALKSFAGTSRRSRSGTPGRRTNAARCSARFNN